MFWVRPINFVHDHLFIFYYFRVWLGLSKFFLMEFSDKMGDSRPEGERNFWNGREAVTAKGGPYVAKKPKNELVTFIHVFKKRHLCI